MTSIIILSYNTKEYTRMCVQSIRKYTNPQSYEIIVVENGSKDGSLNWLLAQPDIHLVVNDENAGFPRGCNQGLRIAQGEELLLLNSDIIVTPRWLEQLKTALYSSDDVGAVGCMSNECPETQKIDVSYGDNLDDMLLFAEKYNHSNASCWHKMPMLMGFCFLFRREIYETIGELDEKFTPGNYEDDDYSLRIRKAGWKLLLCKDTFIHHFGKSSFLASSNSKEKEEKSRRYNHLLEKNRQYFLQKWNLSEKYGIVHKFVEEIGFSIEAPKLLLLHGGASAEAYILQERYPRAQISVIMDSMGDVSLMASDFPAEYCEDIEHQAQDLLRGKYDCILCLENLDNYQNSSAFLERIGKHLTLHGCVVYIGDGQVQVYVPV